MKELWALPSSWRWATFGEVAQVDSNLVDPANYAEFPHIAPNHIESGTGRLLEYTTIADDGMTSGKHLFRAGHILYSKIRPYLAKVVVVGFDGLCSADMYPVSTGLETGFLHRWLVSPMFTQQAARNQGRTVLPKINQNALATLPVPVAPANEQRRIVAKLEALQARSRRAREALDAVPPLLEKLRQSILAAAFRGDLTKDWRAKHKDVEPASKLLERIRGERRKKWEEGEFAKMKAKGKVPSDDKWKARYKEPEAVEATALPMLPQGWCWASVDELASDEPRSIQSGPFGSSLLHSEFRDEGVLAIGIDNVRDGAFSMGAQHRISEEKFRELGKFTARPGDVLITVMATVGRCCTVPDELERAIITKHVYRVSPERRIVMPNYLMHSMGGAPALRGAMKADVRGQTRPGINGDVIRGLPVPVAPLAEQKRVLHALEQALSTLERLQQSQAEVRARLLDLDSSTLAKAFRGDLVPHDPNDEPAGMMLARLRAGAPPQPIGSAATGAEAPPDPGG